MVTIKPSTQGQSINVSVQGTTSTSIQPVSSTSNPVATTNSLAQYYSDLSKEYADESKDYSDLAKDWANKLGDTVDGEEYSSKYYAELTATEYENAKQGLIDKESELESNLNETQTSILNTVEQAKLESLSSISTNTSSSIETIQNEVSESIITIDNERDASITAVDNEATTKKAELQPYVDSASASATSASESKARCEDILDKLGTAIKIKGRVDTFEDLPTSGNLDGDAYLVGLDGLTSYPEYYWYYNHWEFLGTSGGGGAWGTLTGDITEQTDLMNKLNEKQDVISEYTADEVNTLWGSV